MEVDAVAEQVDLTLDATTAATTTEDEAVAKEILDEVNVASSQQPPASKRFKSWAFPHDGECEGMLLVKRLSENATLPQRGSKLAAGLDLCSAEDVILEPNTLMTVKTDISMAIPEGHYGRIAPRSGITIRSWVTTLAGVVDSDFRGPVGVVLYNFSHNQPFKIKKGDRIAQLILEKISLLDVAEVVNLPTTERDQGGFGSTGLGNENVGNGNGNSSTSATTATIPVEPSQPKEEEEDGTMIVSTATPTKEE